MFAAPIISLVTIASLLIPVSAYALAELSVAEADAIIEAQKRAQCDKRTARIAELEKVIIKSEGHILLENGQKVIIREVEPPQDIKASPATPKPLKATAPPSPKMLAELIAQAEKKLQIIMLSATVYDHEVTRLSWHFGSDHKKYVAFTNANFHYLQGIHSLTTDTHSFNFFLAVGDASRTDDPYRDEAVPHASAFSDERSEYTLILGELDDFEATASIETLLAHYDAHLPELKIKRQRYKALAAAKKRYDTKYPQQREDEVINFYPLPQKELTSSNER